MTAFRKYDTLACPIFKLAMKLPSRILKYKNVTIRNGINGNFNKLKKCNNEILF